MKIPAERGALSPPGPPQGLRTEQDRMFSFPRRAHKGTPGWPCSPYQFIPSFVRLLWAGSGPGHGESGASREDSRFIDLVTLPFPASLLVLFRGRPYHTKESSHVLLFVLKKIYFSFGGAGSSLLHRGFASFLVAEATLGCGAWASCRGGFCCCRARAPGRVGSVVVLPGVSCSSMWDFSRPGKEPVSPALASGFLTTGPPGKSQLVVLWKKAPRQQADLEKEVPIGP